MAACLRLNVEDAGDWGLIPPVEKLEDCEALTNADVMQIFSLYSNSALR